MSVPNGLAGQLGYKTESVVGTGVTVDNFLPFLDEGIKSTPERIVSAGMRAGRLTKQYWKSGRRPVGGPVSMELWNLDIAPLLKHLFGSVNTTGTGPYTHTYTPGDLTGKSFTLQIGRPDIGGTVRPFTWAGCKVAKWTLKGAVGEPCTLDLDVVGMTETTATALATASYDANLELFVFTEASITIGGAAVNVKSFELSGTLQLPDRFYIGSGTPEEHLESGWREYTGTVELDFEDLTEYNYIAGDTSNALVIDLDNGTESLTITTAVRYDDGTPETEEGQLPLSLNFTCVSSTSDAAAITAVLVNGESTAA